MVSAALVPRTALDHHECHLLAHGRLRQKKGTLYVTLTKFD